MPSTNRPSHHPIQEGKVVCSNCHNPPGSSGPKMLYKNTVGETCFTCHAEKRGPFLWEHPPVSDNCTNCHMPHDFNNVELLKNRPPICVHRATSLVGTRLRGCVMVPIWILLVAAPTLRRRWWVRLAELPYPDPREQPPVWRTFCSID